MAAIATTLTKLKAHGLLSVGLIVTVLFASIAAAGPLDEMSVERWAKLKEAERFQLNAAERLYREKQYKAAADEYEKFLKLYDRSEGAPYVQLKWSHCQVELRKLNTAIKDGYQTLLDYYPESPEAPVASLLIGRTYSNTGDIKLAKKAYTKVIATYPKHFAAVMARFDLVDIAAKENDPITRINILRELTYDVERKGLTVEPCVSAARLYAHHSFQLGNFEEGLKALATTCKDDELPVHLMHPSLGALPQIVHSLTGAAEEPTRKLGEKLADAAAGWLKVQSTNALKDEKAKPRAVAAWYAIADVRLAARQPDKQKAVYEEMLATLGVDDVLLGHLAQWFKVNNQREQARASYAKFKNATEGQALIAVSYTEEKQIDKAVEIYRKLALADAKTAPKWLALAAAAYRPSKPDPAMAIYRELLVADAANAAEYHFQIAETLYYAQRWKECITAYRGTDRFPHNYNHMAAANRQLKQYDEAIALYSQIIATSPPHAAEAFYSIATTHEQAGRKEDAIKVFKQICDKFPKESQGSRAHAHLNETYKIQVTLGGAKD